MRDLSTIHEVTYSISIRSEYRERGAPIFCGTLQTVSGQKFEFSTLAELNELLCEVCGWIDLPPPANEGGEAKRTDEESFKSGCSPHQDLTEEMK